jgi:hypothetical protein
MNHAVSLSRFRQLRAKVALGATLWTVGLAPNVQRAQADNPIVVTPGAAAVVVGAAVVGYAIYKGVGLKIKATSETTTSDGTTSSQSVEVEVEDQGGGGENPPAPLVPGQATIQSPDDYPGLVLPSGYLAQDTTTAGFLDSSTLSFSVADVAYEADVLDPGFGPSNQVGYEHRRTAEMVFQRLPGQIGAGRLEIPIALEDFDLSTTLIAETFGIVTLDLAVLSPELGTLWSTHVVVPQEGPGSETGDLPDSALAWTAGAAHLDWAGTVVVDLPAALQTVHVTVAFAITGSGTKEEGVNELSWSGGVLGGQLTYHVEGDPFEPLALIPSLTQGPTPLALLDPADPRMLGVGLDLFGLAKFGVIPPDGNVDLSYGLPADLALSGVVLYAQFLTLGGTTTFVDNLSNVTAAILGEQGSSHFAVGETGGTRRCASATALDSGEILFAGGVGYDEAGNMVGLASYELYDPRDSSFVPGAGLAPLERIAHSATKLADGRVVLLGGHDMAGNVLASGDVFEPGARGALDGEFARIAGMSTPRLYHIAVRLLDGRIFVAGGTDTYDMGDSLATFGGALASTEIYDPATDSWTAGPDLPVALVGHAASVLADGRVLITGGLEVTANGIVGSDHAWAYDTIGFVVAPDLADARAFHTQVRTPVGGAAVFGGMTVAEIFGSTHLDVFEVGTSEFYSSTGDGPNSGPIWMPGGPFGSSGMWCFPTFGPNGYCCFPCLPPLDDTGDLLDGGSSVGGMAAPLASGFAGYHIEQGTPIVQGFGTALLERAGGAVAPAPAQGRFVKIGGTDPSGGLPADARAEEVVIGSGSELP